MAEIIRTPIRSVARDDVVCLSMTGQTFQSVVQFLNSVGLTVDPYPHDSADLPQYTVGISDELWNSVNDPRAGN